MAAALLLAFGCSSGSGNGPTTGATDGLTVDSSTTGVFTIFGPEGGPFPQGTRQYILRNRSTVQVDWEVQSSADWLLVFSQDDGVLDPLESTRVDVSIDHNIANGLARGEYPADIVFRDSAGDVAIVYAFQLTVYAVSPAEMAVSPTTPFTPTADVGGIHPPNRRYTIENIGGDDLEWSAEVTEPWLRIVGPSRGTLIAAERYDLVVEVVPTVVGGLAQGTYDTSIAVTNESTGIGDIALPVQLTVNNQSSNGRVTDGLVALYEFDEGSGQRVHDVSGIAPALDLDIANVNATSWVPGALSVHTATIIQAPGAAGKIAAACQATNEITIEAWIRPHNVTQSGPARIVTLSNGAVERNFTLGQGLWGAQPPDTFNVRLRTTTTDDDGMPLLTTSAGSATTGLTHVAYTRSANGTARIYVDGQQAAQMQVGGNFSNWSSDYGFALANEIGAARPWLGDFHLAAVYDRALSPPEVVQNYTSGTGDPTSGQLTVTPAGDLVSSGTAGGPFNPSSKVYTVANAGTEAIQWSASASESWFYVSGTSSGFLDPGDSTQVTVRLETSSVNGFAVGSYTGTLSFSNDTDGYGSTTREVVLSVFDPGGSGGGNDEDFPYFEKLGGALDYMGVKVARTSGSQRVWAPGSAQQEFPGGWVTPGQYQITLNPGRIHGKNDGTLSGQMRSGDQLVGRVVNRPLFWGGWPNWSYEVHADFQMQNWGTSKTVNLQPGDVVHVAYGTPQPVTFGKRQGSDGIVVYCVASEPEYRGGLWATGHSNWSRDHWNFLVDRIHEAAATFVVDDVNWANWGPPDGQLPNPIPSDFGQESGALVNKQGGNVARYLMHRGFKKIQQGENSLDMEEFDRLFRFWANNLQIWGCWSDGVTSHAFMAHGVDWYPPYFLKDSICTAMVAAVALGYDPDYEPLYRLLAHMAQRTDMTLSNGGGYCHANEVIYGGLVAHINDNYYTQWLWNEANAQDMGARSSHRMAAWGPCYWAREVLQFPRTSVQNNTLGKTGPRFGGHWEGHEWSPTGAGPGFELWYSALEIQGAQWLWFSGVQRDSNFAQFSRRSILAKTNHGPFWSKWVADRFVAEPRNVNGSVQGGNVSLSWGSVSGISHYRVYRGSSATSLSIFADNISATSLVDTSVNNGQTYHYAIVAVDSAGNESAKSDRIVLTP